MRALAIHEPLRELLLGAPEELRAGVLELVLRLRGTPTGGEDGEQAFAEEPGAAVDFRTERKAFQFERENVQNLVILFTDIQGYSKKAQSLAPMQLSALIRDYEKILLALVEAHNGELIKRMGDGHLFVFHQPHRRRACRHPAAEVPAALQPLSGRDLAGSDPHRHPLWKRRAQGAGRRPGQHGEHRLPPGELLRKPGSILVSEQVHEKVKDFVHAREIGRITVKNISEPIRVYEPYEIALDLPEALDPMKGGKAAAVAARQQSAPSAESSKASPVDPEIIRQITACFTNLEELCRNAQGGNVPIASIDKQVLSSWARLRPRLAPAPGLPEAT